MTSDKDPWADLAEKLGAAPGHEPAPPSPAQPERPRPTPEAPKPRQEAPRSTDWGGLAENLGVESRPESRPEPRRQARPASRPEPRHDEPGDDARGGARGGWADEIVASAEEGGPPAREGDESGEDRPARRRRRRGRRRGRGRRDEARTGEAGHDDRSLTASPLDAQDARAHDADFDAEEPREGGGRRAEGGDSTAESPADGEGERGPRRRRRGRRGGRRRGRSTHERLADERATAEQPETAQRLDDLDDEPLPTGYGVTPRSAPTGRTEPARPGAGGEDGERRSRRRRRRGSGEARSPRPAREPSAKRERPPRGDDARSGDRSPRGRRRDDFTPVAGRFEEDDEGLEFLGLEEAGPADAAARQRRPAADEAVAESGLDTVREVPSWVEAIGIVIAANLDARSKSGGRK